MGQYIHTFQASDASGNTITATSNATVVDIWPPVVANRACNGMAWCYKVGKQRWLVGARRLYVFVACLLCSVQAFGCKWRAT